MAGRVIIAGGSGFIGISLAYHLAQAGYAITILSRTPPAVSGPWTYKNWDARTAGPWKDDLNASAALINLAGRSVDCIKTPDHQDEILRSRVESTLALGSALREISAPPPVWVQMSTAHIYGDPPSLVCDEDSPPGVGLAPTVGTAWENAFHQSALPGQRKVILRTSFVIGKNRGAGGGAMDRLRLLVRMGLGGRVGSGRQGFSWIHETDLNRLFERAITEPVMQGIYIASSPSPVSQAAFMRELRRAMGMPIGLPAPACLVRLGARWVMKNDPELALYGRYVVSKRLEKEGFTFTYPLLPDALSQIVRG